MSVLIRANLDQPAHLTVERDGETVELTTVNTVITGVPDRWDPSKRVAAGSSASSRWSMRERGGPVVVLGDMWTMTEQTAHALVLPGQGLLHRLQPDHRQAARHLRADEHRRRQPGGRGGRVHRPDHRR